MAKQQGFTLIELLVVIAIMAIVVSLVAPYSSNYLERLQASDEWYQLVRQTRQQQQKAFLTMQPVVMQLKGKNLVIYYQGQQQQHQFTHLYFAEQLITFNGNGFPDHENLTAMQRLQEKTLRLLPATAVIRGKPL